MERLTQERLVEIGFTQRQWEDKISFCHTGLCLFPSDAGVWIVGWDLGTPVTGNFDSGFIPYISNENDLRLIVSKLSSTINLGH